MKDPFTPLYNKQTAWLLGVIALLLLLTLVFRKRPEPVTTTLVVTNTVFVEVKTKDTNKTPALPISPPALSAAVDAEKSNETSAPTNGVPEVVGIRAGLKLGSGARPASQKTNN